MRLTLVLGGARSGKTRWALDEALRMGGTDVTWIATADPPGDDDEMRRRIERHRGERPVEWQTVEESQRPGAALEAARHRVVVLDCLTVLLGRPVAEATTEAEADDAGRRRVEELLAAAAERDGELIVVSNEVGQGVVPAHAMGRWFRDVQGRANQALAEAAERAVWVVAGLPLWLKGEE